MTASELMQEFRSAQSGDWWGDTMAWWFAVAGEMWERGLTIPEKWRYRPSPLGGKEEGQYETEICEQADDDALLIFGRALDRYAAKLKAAGEDY